MKPINRIVLVLTIAILALAGCKKAPEGPKDSLIVGGVSVDMPKLQQTFLNATNEQVRKLLFDADQGFRYGDYNKALAAVDELSNVPDLTDAEKKVATDVVEQLKKLAGASRATVPTPQ